LSSWLAATPGRNFISLQDLMSNLKRFTGMGADGALNSGKFPAIAALPAIRMAWRPVSGMDFVRWDHEMLLQVSGYVYVICMPVSGSGMAHARVMYGTFPEFKVCYFIDPQKNDMSWTWGNMANFKLMIGVAAESCPNWDKKWILPG
jgi:hypothetical protein